MVFWSADQSMDMLGYMNHLWFFQGLDGQSDSKSIHGGCEVLSGEKWSATKWMRQRETS